MMYALVFVACFTAYEPKGCVHKEQYLTLAPMPTTAYVQAQAWMAKWQAEHPGWCVPRWRLEPGRGA